MLLKPHSQLVRIVFGSLNVVVLEPMIAWFYFVLLTNRLNHVIFCWDALAKRRLLFSTLTRNG